MKICKKKIKEGKNKNFVNLQIEFLYIIKKLGKENFSKTIEQEIYKLLNEFFNFENFMFFHIQN